MSSPAENIMSIYYAGSTTNSHEVAAGVGGAGLTAVICKQWRPGWGGRPGFRLKREAYKGLSLNHQFRPRIQLPTTLPHIKPITNRPILASMPKQFIKSDFLSKKNWPFALEYA